MGPTAPSHLSACHLLTFRSPGPGARPLLHPGVHVCAEDGHVQLAMRCGGELPGQVEAGVSAGDSLAHGTHCFCSVRIRARKWDMISRPCWPPAWRANILKISKRKGTRARGGGRGGVLEITLLLDMGCCMIFSHQDSLEPSVSTHLQNQVCRNAEKVTVKAEQSPVPWDQSGGRSATVAYVHMGNG